MWYVSTREIDAGHVDMLGYHTKHERDLFEEQTGEKADVVAVRAMSWSDFERDYNRRNRLAIQYARWANKHGEKAVKRIRQLAGAAIVGVSPARILKLERKAANHAMWAMHFSRAAWLVVNDSAVLTRYM